MERATRKRAGGRSLKEEGSIGMLTERQKEVLSLLAAGKSNKEIAMALYLEPSTVKGARREDTQGAGQAQQDRAGGAMGRDYLQGRGGRGRSLAAHFVCEQGV